MLVTWEFLNHCYYDYPTLTATDLANAWVYAEVYGKEITAEIRANEED
jgi:uncharacterized protein (DUF433 family)